MARPVHDIGDRARYFPTVALESIFSRTFSSLAKHRNYRLYFYGQVISRIGSWLESAAQAWLILELTHSAQAVGVLAFCLYIPYALFGLVGSALADRFDRRKMLIVTQCAMTVCAAALAVVAFAHVDKVWVIDLIAAVRGTIMVFNNPSRQSLIVQLVGRSELQNAIALNSSLNNSTRIIGPAIAGLLIASVGIAWCFALNAISFLAVIAALLALRPSEFLPEGIARVKATLFSSIRLGLQYARRTKTVAVVLGMLMIVSTFGINFSVLLPVLAKQTLGGDAKTYGLITACFGLGALIGALVTASRARIARHAAARGRGLRRRAAVDRARRTRRNVRRPGAGTHRRVLHHVYGQHQCVSAVGIARVHARPFGGTVYLRLSCHQPVWRPLGRLARGTRHDAGVRRGRRLRHRHGPSGTCAASVADADRNRQRSARTTPSTSANVPMTASRIPSGL
jgi:MFS family permease